MQGIEKAFSLSKEEILRALNTSKEGLTSEEAFQRLKIFGENRLKKERQNKLFLLFKQFNNLFIYVLLAAASISFFAGRIIDFFTICVLVLINGLISFWQELKALTSIEALQKLTETQVKIFRNGKIKKIPSSLLVPGDYVFVEAGDLITADVRICEGESTQVDEAILTGESIPVTKDGSLILSEETLPFDQSNMLFSGTNLVKGWAKGVVVTTGKNTYFASIAESIKEKPRPSPLMRAINYFSRGYLALLIALLAGIGVIGAIQGRTLFDLAYILIAYLVSAVPEGLPIVITLVLVIGSLAMSKKKTLVRYLPSVETLGSATILAIDKTGTITEGKVAVDRFYAFDEQRIKLAALLCNDFHIGHTDPIDHALAGWVNHFEKTQKEYPRVLSYPFDVKMRMMATAHEIEEKKILFVKGAFEELEKMDPDQERIEKLRPYVKEFSEKGLRVLAFGEGEVLEKQPQLGKVKIKLLGIVGFLDPAKVGVQEAVLEAKRAKIRVMMITGDHPATAKKIAEDVGIFSQGDQVLTGIEMDKMDDRMLFKALKKISVLARSLPEHKLRLVQVLQKHQEIVAVTGDGVNDVRALKVADLGIAMGNGAEAAIAVSKMVIKDNNLKVIIDAIRNGRVIADNIRKVIYYLLSTSLLEIFLLAAAILGGYPLPMLPVQILWINLVTDSTQDKTFAFIKQEKDVMKRPPRSPIHQFFDLSQIYKIVSFGVVVGVGAFILFTILLKHHEYKEAMTILFTAVAMSQWVNGFQAQKDGPFLKNIKTSFSLNPLIFVGIGIGLGLQLLAIYGLNGVLKVEPMSLKAWGYPILFSLFTFVVVEIRKWFEYFFHSVPKVLEHSTYLKMGKF